MGLGVSTSRAAEAHRWMLLLSTENHPVGRRLPSREEPLPLCRQISKMWRRANLTDDLCESMWPPLLGEDSFICLLLVLLAVLFLASVTMNFCLLVVFFRKRSLRTTSNRFVMNLLVVNLASSLLLLPLVALDLSSPSLYQEQCLVSQVVSQAIASLSLLSTLLVGIDQYLAVIKPLRYHHHMTRTTATLLLIGVWVVSSSVATSFFLLPTPSSTSPLWHSCPEPLDPASTTFSLFLLMATFLLPTITLAAIYCRIYSEAHTSSERTRKNSLAPGSGEGIFNIANMAVVPLGAPSLGSPSLRSSLSRSFRHRVSNASQLMRREEGRTARVYIASLALILFCWAPTYLYSSLPFLMPFLPNWASPILLILSLLYSLVSPFIFAFRHRKVRGEVSRLFSFQPSHPPLPPFTRVQRSISASSGKEQKNKIRHSMVVDKGGKTSNLLECDLLLNSSSSSSFSSSSSLLSHKLEAPAGPFDSDC